MVRKQQERNVWTALALNTIPAIAIAWIGSVYLGNTVFGFFAIFLGLQALYFLIWLKNVIWRWFLYWAFARKQMESHLENYLYQQRFPRPPEFVGGIEDYPT